MKAISKLPWYLVCVCGTVLVTGSAYGGGKRCNPGNYVFGIDECYGCPRGCYCPGNQDFNLTQWALTGSGHKNIANYCGAGYNEDGSDKGKGELGGNSTKMKDDGRYFIKCPVNFPTSNGGAKSITDCYKDLGNGRTLNYSTNIECAEGEYLPKKKRECEKCADYGKLKKNEYCPGGDFPFSETENQGIETCPAGTIPTTDKKECETDPKTKKIFCDDGYALPHNKLECVKCDAKKDFINEGFWKTLKNNEYCEGGFFDFSDTFDQGISTCPEGHQPKDDKTGCSACKNPDEAVNEDTGKCEKCKTGEVPNDNGIGCHKCQAGQIVSDGRCVDEEEAPFKLIHCNYGQYYNGTLKKCDSCKGSTKYCPGGDYNKNLSRDQGIYDCPGGGIVNEKGGACTVTLSKDMMIYGPGGKTTESVRQCWNMHSRISDYIKCLFGGDSIQKKPD